LIALAGLVVSAVWNMSWPDHVAALALLPLIVREAWGATKGEPLLPLKFPDFVSNATRKLMSEPPASRLAYHPSRLVPSGADFEISRYDRERFAFVDLPHVDT
jgi:hypothetical protein